MACRGVQWRTWGCIGVHGRGILDGAWSFQWREFHSISHYVDFGDHIINNCSTCYDGESRVDPKCEETPLDVYDGMGVAWSLSDCYDSPMSVHG
jgi:hypothetical protein